ISFTVSRGEVFAFLGPNGSGKTTTMKAMVGLNLPTAGRILIEGIDGRMHHRTLHDAALPDPPIGSIVEAAPADGPGLRHPHLRIRSDLALDRQVAAEGATWLDRLRVDPNRPAFGAGFGAEVAAAYEKRADWLVAEGLTCSSSRREKVSFKQESIYSRANLAASRLVRRIGSIPPEAASSAPAIWTRASWYSSWDNRLS
ncbi:MAG: DUF3363 domain-containing protein, partial [Brevundimonas sp.]